MIEKVIESLPEDDKVQEMAKEIVGAIDETEPISQDSSEDKEKEIQIQKEQA